MVWGGGLYKAWILETHKYSFHKFSKGFFSKLKKAVYSRAVVVHAFNLGILRVLDFGAFWNLGFHSRDSHKPYFPSCTSWACKLTGLDPNDSHKLVTKLVRCYSTQLFLFQNSSHGIVFCFPLRLTSRLSVPKWVSLYLWWPRFPASRNGTLRRLSGDAG